MLSLSPTRVFTGTEMIEGATVQVRDGKVVNLVRGGPAGTRLEGMLVPGLLDVQVNGGGGVLFNDAPTVDTLARMAAAHAAFGVTGIMATLISDARDKMAAGLDAVTRGLAHGIRGIAGLHLEGPWLSLPKRGVHPQPFLRTLEPADLQLLTQKREFPVLVTLSPEQATPADVKTLTQAGVIVSIGHTAASSEEIEALLAAGATGFTHLFNAMPPLEGRRPGAVGVALATRRAWAGLILDGIHVHPISARVAFAAKTARKLLLVSDAMATMGSKDPMMTLFGERIAVEDGALRTHDGTLAGAHLNLAMAVRNAISMLGAAPEEALRMASLSPAEFLRIDHQRGRIAIGGYADMVLLGPDFEVRKVWLRGEELG